MRDWFKGRLKIMMDFRGTPHQLSFAFGLGVTLGIIPGTGAIAAAALASVLRLNLPLMVAGALLTNPITTPFVYIGSYFLGQKILGDQLGLRPLAKAILSTAIGNLVLAVGLGLFGYLLVFIVVTVARAISRVNRN